MTDIWSNNNTLWTDGRDVIGYDVMTTEGKIGSIDESSLDTDRQHVVVDIGFWIFGKRRMMPAGAITRVDHDDRSVWVNLTKDQIKDAPDFDDVHRDDDNYRTGLGEYYRPFIGM